MIRTCLASLAGLLLVAAPATGAPVALDIPFDRDVVIGWNGSSLDATQTAMDEPSSYVYGTDAALAHDAGTSCDGDEGGLPDDGLIPAGGAHPAFQLATGNANEGNNAAVLETDGELLGLDNPDGRYAELHVVAVSANGNSEIEITLQYDSGPDETVTRGLRDWFGFSPISGTYAVLSGLDRFNTGNGECENLSFGGVWGAPVPVDRSRSLTDITITRRNGGSPDTNTTIFAAVLLHAYTLTVTKAGTGAGTVTGGSIDCGQTCSESLVEGESRRLTALPAEGSRFAGWSGDCTPSENTCAVKMEGDRAVTATFESTAPPPPPPPPPPPGPAAPETLPFGQLASARTANRCARRRRLGLRLKDVAGTTITSATVTVGSHSPRTLTGAELGRLITLRALSRRRFKVSIEVHTADGRTLRTTRTFRKCPKPKPKPKPKRKHRRRT